MTGRCLMAAAAVIAVFAAVNLALSLLTFRGDDPVARTRQELAVLRYSPAEGRRVDDRAFAAVHGQRLGPRPSSAAILAHHAAAAADGVFLLDHVMADHILRRFGRIDARTLPAGVYVGAHALGPDTAPLVAVTKYAAHYLLFPRHAYILIVPPRGPAFTFSASQNGKLGALVDRDHLAAVIALYDPRAYDFPSSGQALHELRLVTDDPEHIARAYARLDRARQRLADEAVTYGLLTRNSNTVVGCILEAGGLIEKSQRQSTIVALRAPGFGSRCPT
ncbi:hypothetical protein P7B02_02915 [Caulobacter segnis]|uniref:hypothetical protein n=1 Tax=Caulobacter segnis TaxID=88688 RepID=UPI00240F696E|nr:hypothetical protein [Caulobacter segnis]MDG2520480.1 hypothetical protein [Caulobacter segnis]